eukprot:6048647-Pleurochrysis_carterae.AAC.1
MAAKEAATPAGVGSSCAQTRRPNEPTAAQPIAPLAGRPCPSCSRITSHHARSAPGSIVKTFPRTARCRATCFLVRTRFARETAYRKLPRLRAVAEARQKPSCTPSSPSPHFSTHLTKAGAKRSGGMKRESLFNGGQQRRGAVRARGWEKRWRAER